MMSGYIYLLAAVLLVVAFLLGRSGPKNRLRARDISGNVVVGDVSGTVSQAGASPSASDPKPDKVAWAIGIVAALIAAAQLAHDVLAK